MTAKEEAIYAEEDRIREEMQLIVDDYLAARLEAMGQNLFPLMRIPDYRNWLIYSAYPTDPYANNLSEIAVEGKVKFVEEAETFFGDISTRKDYESEVVENPTWLELCGLANDMICTVGDNHHIFLESFFPADKAAEGYQPIAKPNKEYKIYRFSMGS